MKALRINGIFFTLFRGHDEVTLEEAFALGKRDPQRKEKNRQWIGYNLARWRKRGFVEAIYGPTGHLSGIRLTKVGKTLLGKPVEQNQQHNPLPPADILEMVRRLKQAHSEWEITFEVRLKEQSELLVSSRVED